VSCGSFGTKKWRFDSVTELRASEASWTAVNRSSSCLYTALASGCAVLQYGRVVKMPNKFTDEQQIYVDIQSVYGFCKEMAGLP